MKKLFNITLLCLLAGTSTVLAQSRHYNTMSLGMGEGGTAYVDGYHANFINPANLMLNKGRKPGTTLGLFGGFGVRAGGTLVNLDAYEEYLTKGLTLEGALAEEALNAFFGSDMNNFRDVSATVNVVPFGFSKRNSKSAFSLSTRARVTEDFRVNRGFGALSVYGLDPDQFSEETPVDFDLGVLAFSEVSLGVAFEVLRLPDLLFAKNVRIYAGIAPKYLVGVQYSQLDFNSSFLLETRNVGGQRFVDRIYQDFNYSLLAAGDFAQDLKDFEEAYAIDDQAKPEDYISDPTDYASINASGFGVDMGATMEMDISGVPILDGLFGKKKTLRVSMSVTDLGSINFDQTPVRISAAGTLDYQGADDSEGSVDDYFNNLVDSLQNDVYLNFDSEDIDSYKYELPAMYNFGASLVMGRLTVAADYGFGFNDNGTNSRRSALNLGAEYRLFGLVPIRAGTRLGGYSSKAYSAGIGLDLSFLELSVAASVVTNTGENGGSAAVAMSGLQFRF